MALTPLDRRRASAQALDAQTERNRLQVEEHEARRTVLESIAHGCTTLTLEQQLVVIATELLERRGAL